MGHFQNCAFSCRNKHIIISISVLLISSFTQMTFMAEGRSTTLNSAQLFKERERELIGSRPPRCERRCSSTCVHCEAVQVPIAPQQKKQHNPTTTTTTHSSSAVNQMSATLYSRGDDLSNYKPMSWKCKCGSFFFDP